MSDAYNRYCGTYVDARVQWLGHDVITLSARVSGCVSTKRYYLLPVALSQKPRCTAALVCSEQ